MLFKGNEFLFKLVKVKSLSHVRLFATPWTIVDRLLRHGILQARILEWVIISFSRGSSQPRDQTWGSWIAGGLLHCRRLLYWLSHQGSPECNQFHSLRGQSSPSSPSLKWTSKTASQVVCWLPVCVVISLPSYHMIKDNVKCYPTQSYWPPTPLKDMCGLVCLALGSFYFVGAPLVLTT